MYRGRAGWVAAPTALLIGACVALAATPAFALLVQPIQIKLQSAGSKATGAITVTNDRRRPTTVEVTVGKLVLPEKGPATETPDKGDDFLIFPPRATIPPGKTQVFRIRWIGEPVIPQSQLYMFATSELPVDQQGSGVQVLYSIKSLVAVTEPKAKPLTSVEAVSRYTGQQPAQNGEPAQVKSGLVVTFANDGAAVDYLSDYRVLISDGSWSRALEPPQVSKSVGLGLIPPHARRALFIELPDVPATGDVHVAIQRSPAV